MNPLSSSHAHQLVPFHTWAVPLLPALLALLMALLILPKIVERGLRRSNRMERNFRGDLIPVSYGLTILFGALVLLGTCLWMNPHLEETIRPWFLIVIGFGLLGYIDDTWGDKKIKGLGGHFRAAFREHRITTGFMKATGGLALALAGGELLHPLHSGTAPVTVAEILLAGLLIALSANAVNLLDLRPGRAAGAFLACSIVILCGCLLLWPNRTGVLLLTGVMLPTLPAWVRDGRAQVMLGDTGSNLLGASLGLAIAEARSLPLQLTALVLLIGLHLLAERVSLTRIIANNRALSALDRLTGVR